VLRAAFGGLGRAILVSVALEAFAVLAGGQRRGAIVVHDAADARAVVTDRRGGGALGVGQTGHARAARRVAVGLRCVDAVRVGFADRLAVVASAHLVRPTIAVDHARDALAAVQVADRLNRAAVLARQAFRALCRRRFAEGRSRPAVDVARAADAGAARDVAQRRIAAALRVVRARRLAATIGGVAGRAGITLRIAGAFDALAEDTCRRGRAAVTVGQAFDAAERLVAQDGAAIASLRARSARTAASLAAEGRELAVTASAENVTGADEYQRRKQPSLGHAASPKQSWCRAPNAQEGR
jgi:hypothetical protein